MNGKTPRLRLGHFGKVKRRAIFYDKKNISYLPSGWAHWGYVNLFSIFFSESSLSRLFHLFLIIVLIYAENSFKDLSNKPKNKQIRPLAQKLAILLYYPPTANPKILNPLPFRTRAFSDMVLVEFSSRNDPRNTLEKFVNRRLNHPVYINK